MLELRKVWAEAWHELKLANEAAFAALSGDVMVPGRLRLPSSRVVRAVFPKVFRELPPHLRRVVNSTRAIGVGEAAQVRQAVPSAVPDLVRVYHHLQQLRDACGDRTPRDDQHGLLLGTAARLAMTYADPAAIDYNLELSRHVFGGLNPEDIAAYFAQRPAPAPDLPALRVYFPSDLQVASHVLAQADDLVSTLPRFFEEADWSMLDKRWRALSYDSDLSTCVALTPQWELLDPEHLTIAHSASPLDANHPRLNRSVEHRLRRTLKAIPNHARPHITASEQISDECRRVTTPLGLQEASSRATLLVGSRAIVGVCVEPGDNRAASKHVAGPVCVPMQRALRTAYWALVETSGYTAGLARSETPRHEDHQPLTTQIPDRVLQLFAEPLPLYLALLWQRLHGWELRKLPVSHIVTVRDLVTGVALSVANRLQRDTYVQRGAARLGQLVGPKDLNGHLDDWEGGRHRGPDDQQELVAEGLAQVMQALADVGAEQWQRFLTAEHPRADLEELWQSWVAGRDLDVAYLDVVQLIAEYRKRWSG